MKNNSVIFSVLYVGVLLLFLFNCKKEDIKTAPTVTIAAVTNITATTATSGGEITSDGGASVTSRGVCWSANQNPTTQDTKTSNSTGTGSFTSSLTGLTAGATYYLKAYATNSIGTAYSSQISLTTLALAPVLTTTAVSAITSSTATSGGIISNNGGAAVTVSGVCWGTSTNPTTALSTKTTDGSLTGTFTGSITGLTPGTIYYVRAYATNSIGTGYGTQITITTLANLPTVTTATLTNITSISATGGGIVVSDGGATVTARGVCWSTSSTPTIIADSKTTNGTGLGSFTSSITGLLPGVVYYVRAYATNSAGTAYGASINGLTTDVNNLVPQSIIDALKNLGMPINSGVIPPIVNGIYNATPLKVKATNITGDSYYPGYQISDLRVQFANQDNTKLTLAMDYVNGPESGSGFDSFIVGNGKLFTVFVKVNVTNGGVPAIIVQIYSGSLETTVINNFYYAIFMVENYGRNDVYMSNNSGRVFYDSDGVSEKVASLKAAHIPIVNQGSTLSPMAK